MSIDFGNKTSLPPGYLDTQNLDDKMGDLSTLPTDDKTSLVNSIAEVFRRGGTVTPNEASWTATQGQTVFSITSGSYNPNAKSLWLFVDGVKQVVGTNYTETDSRTITLSEGVDVGTIVEAVWIMNSIPSIVPINTLNGFGANVSDPINTLTSNLAENPKHLTQYDVFADSGKTVLDRTKLTNVFNANNGLTFYLPDGNYTLNGTVTISNNVNLLLSPGAVIQASVSMTDMIAYNYGSTDGGKNRFIRGGVLDGNGLATNCLTITNSAHLCVEDMIFKNPISNGLNVLAGYELLGRNLFFNNTITSNISGNIGIYLNTSDAMFRQIIITNYTTGIEIVSAGNFFSDVHIWCSQSARIPSTVGINNQALGIMYDKIYFDTLATGLLTNHRTFLTNCLFNFGNTFYQYLSSPPSYINNTVADFIVVENAFFEFTSRSGYTDTVTLASGNPKYVTFKDCDFATPTTLTGVPDISVNRRPKISRYQITFTMPSLPAGSYQEKDITITDPNVSIAQRDTVIFNTLGYPEPGVILSMAMKGANIVKVRMSNTTSAAITTALNTIYLTVIQNIDGSTITYSSPTVTGN